MLDPEAMRARAGTVVPRLIGGVLALVLLLYALAALADAVLVGWLRVLGPGWASLAAAITYLVLAVLVLAGSRHIALRRRTVRAARPVVPLSAYGLLADVVRDRPAVTLLVLDLHPARRGMASSLQMFVGSGANAITAGVIAPFVMHSTLGLAAATVGLMSIGLVAWITVGRRWPLIGRLEDAAVAGRPSMSVGG